MSNSFYHFLQQRGRYFELYKGLFVFTEEAFLLNCVSFEREFCLRVVQLSGNHFDMRLCVKI